MPNYEWRMNEISPEDARWLALLMDTEGYIGVRKSHTTKNASYCAWVSIGNTSRQLLEVADQMVGLGAILTRQKNSSKSKAPMHYWQLTSKQAAQFLRTIYPYLIVKQDQAKVAIYTQSLNKNRGGAKGYYGKGTRPFTNEEVALRQQLWNISKELNHHGKPDISWIPEPHQIIKGNTLPIQRGTYQQFVDHQDGHPELLSGGEINRMFGTPHRMGYRWAERYKREKLANVSGMALA